jgi:hypothetical protein
LVTGDVGLFVVVDTLKEQVQEGLLSSHSVSKPIHIFLHANKLTVVFQASGTALNA